MFRQRLYTVRLYWAGDNPGEVTLGVVAISVAHDFCDVVTVTGACVVNAHPLRIRVLPELNALKKGYRCTVPDHTVLLPMYLYSGYTNRQFYLRFSFFGHNKTNLHS